MDGVILAGGFAKRLRDEVPLARTVPKPLLPLNGKPIIEYILKKIKPIEDIQSLYILTNQKWENNFRKWLKKFDFCKELTLSVLPFRNEAEDPGAVGGLGHFIKAEEINKDLLIIAGDNLFNGFNLVEFVKFQQKKDAPVIACYNIKDKEKAKNYGVVLLDEEKEIIKFCEKPRYVKSTLVSTACYIYPRRVLSLIAEYLGNKKNPTDAPGHFVQWLYCQEPVYGFVFEGAWFDIGSKESYEKAEQYAKTNTRARRIT